MQQSFVRRHSLAIRQKSANSPIQIQLNFLDFIRTSLESLAFLFQRKLFLGRHFQRKVICFAVVFNLLLWPGPGLASRQVLGLVSRSLDAPVGVRGSYEAYLFGLMFGGRSTAAQHDTMADRASAVVHIQLNPIKFVGYVDETILSPF